MTYTAARKRKSRATIPRWNHDHGQNHLDDHAGGAVPADPMQVFEAMRAVVVGE